MMRTPCDRSGLQTLLGGLTALILGALTAHATTIGFNFSDDWGSDGGAAVTHEAFGVPAANWYNLPRVFNSNAGSGISSNTVITLPEGGSLAVEWSCINTWSLTADIPTDTGVNEVVYGYLDDTGTGYRVRFSGFRDSMADFAMTLIASTDSGEGFKDAFVASGSGTNFVSYTEIQNPDYAAGIFSVSSETAVFSTLATNNVAIVRGVPREGSFRSTLAGLLIRYTPGGRNPPIIEEQPQPPSETVFVGSPFHLEVVASGTALKYQWRLAGEPIPDATGPVYANPESSADDSGDYDVIVSNNFGSVTSRVATVTLASLVSPSITTPPASQSLFPGYPATFRVDATGGQLSYQWRHNGAPIPGATQDTLNLASITAADRGSYEVQVSNSKGSVTGSGQLTVLTPTTAYEGAIAASRPIVYFRMNETASVSQNTATNLGSTGTVGTGLYEGSLARGTPGALAGNTGTAVTLSGGHVSVAYNPAWNPSGSFSVECWAKPVDTEAGSRVLVQSMINGEFPDNSDDRSGWCLRQRGADLQFLIGGSDANPPYVIITATGALVGGVWSHAVATYEAGSRVVTLYVNGVVVATETSAAAVLPNTAAPLLLGDRGYGGWTFPGSLDEVAVYPVLLGAGQVQSHYQAALQAATAPGYRSLVVGDGAVVYLTLDGDADPTIASNLGTLGGAWNGIYQGAGTTVGDPLISTGGTGPRPADFPGFEPGNLAVAMTNGWVTSPDLPLGNSISVLCWIRREDISTTGDLSWPAWLGGGGLHLNNGNAGNPDAELRYHWNGDQWGWESGLWVPPNVWTFAALVIEPDKATLYKAVNGVLESAVNTATHAPMVVMSPPGFGGNEPGRADRDYIGLLDEVAVYDRALTAAEVAAIVASSTSTAPVPPGILDVSGTPGAYVLTWTSGILQSSKSLSGPYAAVPGASSPYPLPGSGDGLYYRLTAP
ncbi:MAG: immunoglobulin domain-containing protein [Verrucomicrobiales bacterium]|nr:immunoglobulin domain-containing protein [Verrucomicrobiales bacterium]